MTLYDMFIYCSCVSTRRHWSVDCTKFGKRQQYKKDKQYTKEFENTEYTKWETKIQQKQI